MAEHYLTCAKQMTNPKDKAALMSVAQFWTELAEDAERKERQKK
jgi:hypothetical protein